MRARRPEEGWLSIALVAAMGLVLAWAIDDPSWVQGKSALTDGLPLCALLGFAAGLAGAKAGWSRWTTHVVGALFAGLLLPVLAGWALHPGLSVGEAFRATAEGSANAYLDLAWRGRRFTMEEIHYVLVLGGVAWATMQFAAYAVYGHRRPLNAIVVVGLVLLANMALTSRDELMYLVAFVALSLFLLVGIHVVDERAMWMRRRIGDPGAISGLYLRGGTIFIAVAMLGALVLTQQARSSPLAGAWGQVDQQLIAWGERISRLFPVGGDVRGTGSVTFGGAARISGRWFSNDDVAFVATLPANAPQGLTWRAATYDTFQLDGWVQTGTVSTPVAAGQVLLTGLAEFPTPELVSEVGASVRLQGYRENLLLSPGLPTGVDRDATVLTAGPAGWLAGVELGGSIAPYRVSADRLLLGDQDVITGNRLRVAGTDYPADVTARYTAVPSGAMGSDAAELLAAIKATLGTRDDPYSLAVAMVTYLRDDTRFTYSPDIREIACDSTSAVECFARNRTGYCLHYASTMAVLMRAANPSNPIPTRLVQGFLPGKRAGAIETVTNRSAHAWVEVFFPGFGWIPFDPTGGSVGQVSEIRDGPPVASPSPTPRRSTAPDVPDPTRKPGVIPPGGTPGPTAAGGPTLDRTLAIILAILVAIMIGGLVLAAWLRGPRGEISPDAAWRTMSRVASRLGFAPRPTQTVYEYATSLGELVPVAKADLHTVAEAKVETAYARVRLGGERLDAVRDATRRLRLSLLRLAFRRRRRRPR
jgi:transglutaminase-like putative cysteine protease